MMRSSNPALSLDTFSGFGRTIDRSDRMTIGGTVLKTAILLLCALLSAGYTWGLFMKSGGNPASVAPWMIGGAIGGFAAAMATIFKKEWAPVSAPLYAFFEGLFIGGISSVLEAQFPGIVIQAAGLTFGTMAMMLFLYQSGLVRATEKFKMGIFAATGAIALVYIVSLVLSFFGVYPSFIYGSTPVGIGFSLVVVAIAALNFIIDFDFIENGARHNVPKYMEWYGGFAMMVTLIWLYIEFMRLLSKVKNR